MQLVHRLVPDIAAGTWIWYTPAAQVPAEKRCATHRALSTEGWNLVRRCAGAIDLVNP